MTIAKKTGGRPSKRPTNAELAMLYSVMTAKEIAERFDVSVYTVRNWINRARKEESEEVTNALRQKKTARSDCNGNALNSKFNYW